MKLPGVGRPAMRLGAIALLVSLCVGRAETQNPSLGATFGSVKLKAGFLPDPYTRNLVAGGNIQTKLGGVTAWVANAPAFKLYYEAGNFPLTIYVESGADTTLLINLPDGSWIADDDSGGNLNPLLKFARPQSGRNDIWVGTIGRNTANATLKITELK
jgi:hypothetical protein